MGSGGEEFNSFNKSKQAVVTRGEKCGIYEICLSSAEAFDPMSATTCIRLGAFHSAA